jgi:NADH dehydrogenase
MTRRLLDAGHEVLAVTNSVGRANPFGERVRAVPYDFAHPTRLEASLRGVDVLINNYWVRFDHPPLFTHASAVANARTLFDAASRAGVGRIVHISITNPDRRSALPYFSGKAEMEEHLKSSGLSYAILRPTVLFGKEDILINNIAWALRHLPVFGMYGDGRYRLQPIHVDDLAAAVVARIDGPSGETIDAIGPETFEYRDMVSMIARAIDAPAAIVPLPPRLAFQAIRVLGLFVGDVITTREEIRGLMEERLYVDSPPLGATRLSEWVDGSRRTLGRRYTSEMARRLDRRTGYGSN